MNRLSRFVAFIVIYWISLLLFWLNCFSSLYPSPRWLQSVECLLPIPYTPLWGDALSVVESRGFYKVRLFGIYRVSLMVRRRRVRFSQSE